MPSSRSWNGATPTTSPQDPVIDPPVIDRPSADARLTAITVEGVSKTFKDVPVIRDVSLDIRAGELLGLLGPSGSGKTTLLRIIAGLETPDAGRIRFGGADTTAVPVQKRAVGFVFQHYALFKHMTVADNVAYGLRARRRRDRPSRDEIAARVGDLLDLVKLSAFADRYPSQLSGGQRQRIALARALAVEPRVLLLDEPFGALDAQVRKDLRRWLRDIHERTGQTTIFVTHDQDEALELSDRVAVLHAGRLEQVGTPAEMQDRPATAAVMRFLGDTIELPATVDASGVLVGGRPVPVEISEHAQGPARLLLRPWQFELASPDTANLRGTVRGIHRAGGRSHLLIEHDGTAFTIILPTAPSIGQVLDLRLTGGCLFS